jgi:hypothetical protein
MKNVMKYAATFFVVIILVALGSWIEYGRAGMVTVTGTIIVATLGVVIWSMLKARNRRS